MAKKYAITVRMFDIPSEEQIHAAFQHILDMSCEDHEMLMGTLVEIADNPGEEWLDISSRLMAESDNLTPTLNGTEVERRSAKHLADMWKRTLEDHLLHGACKKIPQDLRTLDIWDQTQGEATLEYDAHDWLLEGEQLTRPFSIRLFMMAYTGVFDILGIETSGSNLPRR